MVRYLCIYNLFLFALRKVETEVEEVEEKLNFRSVAAAMSEMRRLVRFLGKLFCSRCCIAWGSGEARDVYKKENSPPRLAAIAALKRYPAKAACSYSDIDSNSVLPAAASYTPPHLDVACT